MNNTIQLYLLSIVYMIVAAMIAITFQGLLGFFFSGVTVGIGVTLAVVNLVISYVKNKYDASLGKGDSE